MATQPKALEIADRCQGLSQVADAYSEEAYREAAAELRRLHAENERLVAEVANRNRRALDGDEAVTALANVHAYYEGLEAQCNALLEALRALVQNEGLEPYSYLDKGIGTATAAGQRWLNARAVIAAAKGEVNN